MCSVDIEFYIGITTTARAYFRDDPNNTVADDRAIGRLGLLLSEQPQNWESIIIATTAMTGISARFDEISG